MSYEVSGRLIELGSIQQISDKFRKREFVIEKKETSPGGLEFVDYVKFQLIQDKVNLIDSFQPDDVVKVSFNIKGNKWERDGKVNYFTNLDAWRIEKAGASDADAPPPPAEDAPPTPGLDDAPPEKTDGYDDLPF
jgi:hypothetical protein